MKDAPKVYLVRAGRHGQDEDHALEHNLAVIGFLEVPSLEGAQDYDAMVQLVQDALPDGKPRALGNFARQLWAFAGAMQEGDLVRLATQDHVADRYWPGHGAVSIRRGEHDLAAHTARGVDAAGHPPRHVRTGPTLFVRRVHDGLQHLPE